MPLILGRVRSPDGAPVAQARIAIGDAPVPLPDIAALSDDDGRFVMTAPAPGSYEITAITDAATATTTVIVSTQDVEVDLRIDP